jgi:L-fuculose-phosphate aldolase
MRRNYRAGVDYERQCKRVAAAGRRLAAEGLVVGTAGNVSVREGDAIAISASGVELTEMDAGDAVVVDTAGAVLAGDRSPSSELALHLGIYARADAGAVVHTHAPMATALACVLDGELPCIHYQMLELGASVRIAAYETFGTEQLADSVLRALEGKGAALIANHGAVTHAPDLDAAVERMLLLEWACGLYVRASVVGEPRALSEEQLEAARERYRDYG